MFLRLFSSQGGVFDLNTNDKNSASNRTYVLQHHQSRMHRYKAKTAYFDAFLYLYK